MTKKDILLAILITFIWGLNFSVIKLGLTTLDPFMITGLRFLLVALPLVFFIKKPNISIFYISTYGILFGVGLWGIVTLGIQYGISAGLSSLLLQSSVFFTIILGAVFLKEDIDISKKIGFIFGLIGIIIIFSVTDGTVSVIGALLVIMGAIFWSIANIVVKNSKTKDMFAFIIWSSLFSPIPLFILSYLTSGSIVFNEFLISLDYMAIFSILFQAYPTTLFGYWIWNTLLKKYPASTVAPISLLVPFFGLLGSYMIFDEQIGLIKIIACLFIVVGLAINIYGIKIVDLLYKRNV